MAFWKSNLALNSSEYTTMGVNTRLKRADFFPQWVCLVEDISIVVQSGIRSHSQTSHIYQVWGFFFFFSYREVFQNKELKFWGFNSRGLGRHVGLRQTLSAWRTGWRSTVQSFSKCTCSVHTVCVRSAHASYTQCSMWVCIINYTSSTLEAIIEIIWLFFSLLS